MASFIVKLPYNQYDITLAMPYGSVTLRNGDVIHDDRYPSLYPQYFKSLSDVVPPISVKDPVEPIEPVKEPVEPVKEPVEPVEPVKEPVTKNVEKETPKPKDEKVEPPKVVVDKKIKKNIFKRG